MAIIVEQTATAHIESGGTAIDLAWATAPAEGDDVITVFAYAVLRTITRPSAEINGSWTTPIGPVDLGSDGTRDLEMQFAEAGSGSDTLWPYASSPADLLGAMGISVSGLDTAGTIHVESIVDAASPIGLGPLDGDPSPDPTTPHLWIVGYATKWFGATAEEVFTIDDGFTEADSDSNPAGTRWSIGMAYKILSTGKPTVTVTSDKSNATGSGLLIGIPEAGGATITRTFTGALASGDLVGDTIKETRHTLTGFIGGEGLFGDLFKKTAKLHEGTIGIAQLTGALSVRLAFFRLMTGLLALADLTGAFGPSKTAKGLSGATTPTGDPQLKIAATYEGATTPAGALTKFSPRAFAGAITVLTGDLIRKTGKPLTGAIATITGALTQRTAKLLEGTIATAAGDLILKTSKLLEGTLTSSGFSNHIIPLFQILVAGAITSAGAITLKTATLLEGVVSSSAELRRKTAALYEGTIASGDLTGALTNIKKILVTFTGAITTLTGELLRQTQHTPSGAITSSATLTQRIAKLLEGNITPTGFSNHILPLFKIAIGGALTFAGALIRQTQHTETASITPAGQYGPSKIAATYEGTTTQTGDLALTRTIVVALSGALTLAGGLIRKTAARITGTAGSSGALIRSTATTMTGAITPSGDLRRKTSVIFAAILTLAGALANVVIPPAVAGPISRIIRHQGRAGGEIRHQGKTGRQI